jgi:periplasmic copper chaperone A
MFRNAFFAATATAIALCAGPLVAAETKLKDLLIDHPYARPTPPGATVAEAYLKVRNAGKDADRLVRAASPIAGVVEIREMFFEQNVMKVRSIPGLGIKPGDTLTLQPGSYHIMLMDLKAPLAAEQRFPMTLTFERAGSVDVAVEVEAAGASTHTH